MTNKTLPYRASKRQHITTTHLLKQEYARYNVISFRYATNTTVYSMLHKNYTMLPYY